METGLNFLIWSRKFVIELKYVWTYSNWWFVNEALFEKLVVT
jgi:hypothetical protein